MDDLFHPRQTQKNTPFEYSDKNKSYSLEVDVPGFSKKDLNISVSNNYLKISGKDPSQKRADISFSAETPSDINLDSISCSLNNGVLLIKADSKLEAKTIKIS